MKTLIKMTDFVLEQSSNENLTNALNRFNVKMFDQIWCNIFTYAQFLKQTPQLWMFVPCDREGNVLEEPKDEKLCKYCPIEENKRFASANSIGCEGSRCDVAYENYEEEYNQAKERCYFEGFEYQNKELYLNNELFWMFSNNELKFEKNFTIEDLIPYNLTLAATAQKEIG